ncbi:MAG: T9SS type A sorting domain-containing protein [Bacteroidetes bacterium]|nr:T9SS type A sorting domain-containing protein [Bacteroidota bacterium]
MLNWGRYALLIILFVCSGLIVSAQTNPAPFNLGGGNYFMGTWINTSPALTYPANMIFHTCSRDSNPLLGDPTTANYTGAYNIGTGNRFAGLGAFGYSQYNYSKTPNTIGASVLGLNSTGRTDIIVTWTTRAWAVGNAYNLRLQYRISTVSPWLDVPGPIEYIYNGTLPNQQTISVNLSIATANAVDNRANMQVRWKYYYVSGFGANSCNLSIDDINVSSLASVGDNISTGVIGGSPFCVSASTSGSVTVPFTYASAANFTAGGCTFSAELSNSAGQFLSPTVIGTVVSNASGAQSIVCTLPPGLGTGTSYRIRVTSDAPSVVGVDNGSDLTIYLSPFDVTSPSANCINLASNISWVLPVGCYNEIMVVAQPLVPFTVNPAGNGSAYTANATYGSGTAYESGFVVYKGPGTNVTISNLANATLYYYKIFVRYGNEWSSGEEVSCSPGAGTLLKRGDFLVMGVNATNSCGVGPGTGPSADEISFVCFRDITIGTTLDITDNGYNRSAAFPGRWGDTEGVVRLTRTGGTIFAGTIITIRFDAGGNGFAISPDANWSFINLNAGGVFNMNSGGDQFHFMQGGNWINGGGAHDGIYTGTVLFGFNTANSWIDYANSSQQSGLFPKLDCYVILPATGSDYIKYTGNLATLRTQRAWVDQINTVTNWTSYPSNCAGYNAAIPQYHLGASITIVAGGYQRGKWLGAKNTDWYTCTNWEDFVVPDSTTDVLIPSSGVTFNCRLRVDSVHACRDLNIQGYKLIGADTNVRVLRILGNLNITGGELDFSDNNPNTKDGVIQLMGNWTNFNEAAFREGNSRVYLIGTSLQAINTPVKEVFYRLDIDNLADISGGTNLQVDNILTLTNGLINTGSNEVYMTSTSVTSIAGYTLSRYINGKLRRQIAISGNYDFPVGTSINYELANLNIASQVGMANIIVDFDAPSPGAAPNPALCFVNGSSIANKLDAGSWSIVPNTVPTAINLSLTLKERGHTNSVAPASRYGIIRRDDASSDWLGAPFGTHANVTQSEVGGTATAVRTGITTTSFWGDFAIGFGNAPLPVEWLSFEAKPISSNVLLQWKTASESGNDYFNVERSRNGLSFEKIGQVQGNGSTNTISSYTFTDYAPGRGIIYYRLQQVDIDGRFDLSKIVPVRIGDDASTPYLFPNPVSDQTYFMINSDENIDQTIEIFDIAGHLIFTQTVTLQKGNNSVSIYLGGLPAGVYMMRNGTAVIKLLKY